MRVEGGRGGAGRSHLSWGHLRAERGTGRHDPGAADLLRPENVANPLLHRFYDFLRARALDPEAPLPPPGALPHPSCLCGLWLLDRPPHFPPNTTTAWVLEAASCELGPPMHVVLALFSLIAPQVALLRRLLGGCGRPGPGANRLRGPPLDRLPKGAAEALAALPAAFPIKQKVPPPHAPGASGKVLRPDSSSTCF